MASTLLHPLGSAVAAVCLLGPLAARVPFDDAAMWRKLVYEAGIQAD